MKKTLKQKAGFTLLELLVVIAIIGILAAVTLTLLNSNRIKANRSKVHSMLRGVLPLALLCDSAGGTMNSPSNTINGGGDICGNPSVVGTWPSLSGTGWQYTSVSDVPNDGAFFFQANLISNPATAINCDQTGCR